MKNLLSIAYKNVKEVQKSTKMIQSIQKSFEKNAVNIKKKDGTDELVLHSIMQLSGLPIPSLLLKYNVINE